MSTSRGKYIVYDFGNGEGLLKVMPKKNRKQESLHSERIAGF
jgi:hypothetical protein